MSLLRDAWAGLRIPAAWRGAPDDIGTGEASWQLFLYVHRRPADALAIEVDFHLDAVSDLDEGDSAVHPVVFAVEGQYSLDVAFACPDTGDGQRQGLRSGDAADGEGAGYVEGIRTGLNDFV
jgi:hypothetical protein